MYRCYLSGTVYRRHSRIAAGPVQSSEIRMGSGRLKNRRDTACLAIGVKSVPGRLKTKLQGTGVQCGGVYTPGHLVNS